jgi:hypothetical protein
MIDEFFIVLLLIGLGVISLGCILLIISEISERKQEIKDFKQSKLNNSFNRSKSYYKYEGTCYCKRCQANRQNKRRTSNIHLN